MSLWDFVANLFKYFLQREQRVARERVLLMSHTVRGSQIYFRSFIIRTPLESFTGWNCNLGSLVELQKWITAIARFYELESTLFVIVGQHRSRGVKISLHPFAVLFYCTLSRGWVAEAYSSGHTERKTTICTHTTDNLQSPWGWREPENVKRTHTDSGKTC